MSLYSRENQIEVLFMFYECNGQCNNREVMSSDHHVIGSRFADNVNVINVTATDFYPKSILSKLPISSQFQMFLVKFSEIKIPRVLINCFVSNISMMLSIFDQHRQRKLNLNFQSKIPLRISYSALIGTRPGHFTLGIVWNCMVWNGIIWYVWNGMVSYGMV